MAPGTVHGTDRGGLDPVAHGLQVQDIEETKFLRLLEFFIGVIPAVLDDPAHDGLHQFFDETHVSPYLHKPHRCSTRSRMWMPMAASS
jgi:hypothetical protein